MSARRRGAAVGRGGPWGLIPLAFIVVFWMTVAGGPTVAQASPAPENRYELANGCYALRAFAADRLVIKDSGGYRAGAGGASPAERFRMQATTLGRYLFYGRARDFLVAGSLLPIGSPEEVEVATRPGRHADWTVTRVAPGAFRIEPTFVAGKVLAAAADGRLELVDDAATGPPTQFGFEPTGGCATFPEADVNAVGRPSRGTSPYDPTRGLVDAHIHMMAFEFLGGNVHCGRPWSPYGVTVAMRDCPDHQPNGCAALLENTASYGNPVGCHDPVGWPTFRDWPHHQSLTHEQTYWKGLERAWRGGLRVYVNLFVENHAGCVLFPPPVNRNSCNEMDSVRLQAKDIYKLQDYIDAQYGGPGKGFFRIVTNPFEARRVINAGKLAVVLGIEVSEPFDCKVRKRVPQCDRAQIDRGLDEVYRLGVRDMELINKYDNALGGVAGDAGTTGVAVNSGNFFETGDFWHMETCTGPEEQSDHEQLTLPGVARDPLIGNVLQEYLPPGTAPIYPAPPHCNAYGLTALGEYMAKGMMRRGMIIDPDHLSVLARRQLLDLLEAERYPGVVSSHSWSTSDAYPRIYDLGGFVAPYAGSSEGFVGKWRELRPERNRNFFFGFGYGADMNGFGSQGEPREATAEHPSVSYPFESLDGAVTLDRARWGERVWDINTDGVAHYGLYPDWVEDLRMLAGDRIVRDMARGSEAYLQMWERAVGVPAERCRPRHGRLTEEGLGRLRLGASGKQVLRRAGQPARRVERGYRYCVNGRENRGAKVGVAFTREGEVGLVATTAPGHEAAGVAPGAPASRIADHTTALSHRLRVREAGDGGAIVYGIRDDRVRFVAAATPEVTSSQERLRIDLGLAGMLEPLRS